ncbi:MAG: type II secretion system F family protein [Bacilli bacterium]|nr:type II secretion system F family protein [Bacilli bacterium]
MNKEEFIRRIYSKKYIDKQIAKIRLLGTGNKLNVYDLMIGRLASSVLVFIVILCTSSYGYITAPFLTLLYYLLFNRATLDDKIKKRQVKLEAEAMHFFEVLTLSLETGRNLVEAIEVTTANVSGILSNEFKETVREVNFGKSLNEALSDMQTKIPSDTISNIILSLTESNLYGNSIIKNLYNQIDFLREKRKMEVKGRISKVPVLISAISVLFFIPLLLLIILGPILLEYIG